MAKVLSSTNGRVIFFGGILILSIMAGLSGCTPIAAADAPPAQSFPCPVPPANANIYKVSPAPAKWADDIFQHVNPSYTILPSLNEQLYQEARYATFQRLITETKRWSKIETVKLDDSSEIQIIMTLIDPNLIQAVYLSQVIRYKIFVPEFPAQIKSELDYIGTREELLFFVTIMTVHNGNLTPTSHKVEIQARKIIIINSEDLPIAPSHDDHNLNQPIDTLSEPIFGYLAYPFTTLLNNECKWILDPQYNTNVVITASKIVVDGAGGDDKYTWTIPYTFLVKANIPPTQPQFMIPSGYDLNQIAPLTLPPIPAKPQNGSYSDEFWRDFARFIWNQLTPENY